MENYQVQNKIIKMNIKKKICYLINFKWKLIKKILKL